MDILNIQSLVAQGLITNVASIDPNNTYVTVGVYQPGNRLSGSGNNTYPSYAIPISEFLNSTGAVTGSGTVNYIPKWTPSGTALGNSVMYEDAGKIGIGTITPAAKLDILQNTVGTGAKGLSVNFATIGETFYIDDNGYAKYYGGGFTIAGSNGILNLVSNGGVSPSINFQYNNGSSTSGSLYGVGASMFFQTSALGVGSVYSNPQAKLHILGATNIGEKLFRITTTSGLWDILDVGQGTITSAVNNWVFKASGTPGTGANPTITLYDETGGNPALYMYSSLYGSNTLAIDGLGIPRFTAVYSNRLWFNSNVGVGLIATTDTRLYVQGSDATSSNYALKVDNSATTSLLYAKNDGEIGMNGFTIRQLASATYFKTSGTGGYMFNNAADSTNLGKITNTGQMLFGDISDVNYVGAGIAVKALSLTSNATKEIFAAFFKSNTDQDGLYFSSKQGSVYIQPYAVNSVNQSLILGGRNSVTGVLETLILKSSGVINTPTLPTSNAGLSTGDLYVETAANILANGDKVVGWKV